MPVTYALLTPLALFTLDTASWETRNHEESLDAAAAPTGNTTGPVPALRDSITAEIMKVGEPAHAQAVARRSHAQLPAA
jgi:hypothetical protein